MNDYRSVPKSSKIDQNFSRTTNWSSKKFNIKLYAVGLEQHQKRNNTTINSIEIRNPMTNFM